MWVAHVRAFKLSTFFNKGVIPVTHTVGPLSASGARAPETGGHFWLCCAPPWQIGRTRKLSGRDSFGCHCQLRAKLVLIGDGMSTTLLHRPDPERAAWARARRRERCRTGRIAEENVGHGAAQVNGGQLTSSFRPRVSVILNVNIQNRGEADEAKKKKLPLSPSDPSRHMNVLELASSPTSQSNITLPFRSVGRKRYQARLDYYRGLA
jgi:hypothetical protein